MGRDEDTELLRQLLKEMQKLNGKVDHIEQEVEQNARMIEEMNTGVVKRVVRLGTQDVSEACGVVAIGADELIGESGPRRADTAAKKAERARKQAAGARYFTIYLSVYAVLMVLSFLKLLPVFEFELMEFAMAEKVSVWLRAHMYLPFVFSVLYVIFIFTVRAKMESRERLDLRKPLAAWSMALAVFSLCGSLRTVPVVVEIIRERGLLHLVCGDTRNDWVINNPAGVWTMLFIFSKVPELVDTVFIVLRKSPLITLHWYHHITVMLFCWHSWATFCLNGVIYSAMNLTVHAVMYFFYACTALGYRPTQFAKSITVMQILQMIGGTTVTFYVNYHMNFIEFQEMNWTLNTSWDALHKEENKEPFCKVHPLNATFGLIMYSSYLWLFCLFFYYAYINPLPKKNQGKLKKK